MREELKSWQIARRLPNAIDDLLANIFDYLFVLQAWHAIDRFLKSCRKLHVQNLKDIVIRFVDSRLLMVQQWGDLFGRIQARSPGRLHHDAGVFQDLLFGALLQLATNDVCSPEEAQDENRNKNKIEEDQKFKSPHKASDIGRDKEQKIRPVTRQSPVSAPEEVRHQSGRRVA